ncbi:hypothetical protein AMATHDRAFT_67688 [Amanita thiersii Skay4041]|uniref:Beta-lactamase-related domain-containing protein n=1 Tax=Amanita thiersii Skay4041 TaxID=703135 RepID=A0A2A9NIA3_9AGAR|nr:hypothetical protein AMATHDRAFT_67688 [Amanita thiersii Skay4041]
MSSSLSRALVAVLLCTGFISQICALQQPFYTADSRYRKFISPNVDALAKSMLSSWNSSGLAVAVVRRDGTAPGGWHREFASYEIAKDDGTPVTPDTLFSIASNSKLFLALSTGLLISNETLAQERGSKVAWNTKAQDILPGWGLMDEVASRGVNLQDMMSHRTGMAPHDFSLTVLPGGTPEMISTLKYLRPSAEFREVFQYSNSMYESLTVLPLTLLNQSFEAYVTEHLFNPLNMSSSTYSVKDAEASGQLAHGFQWTMRDLTRGIKGARTATIPYYSRNGSEKAYAGAGGVISSARDLSIWVSMLLNTGRHPETNETVVPEHVVEHVGTGVTVLPGRTSYPEFSPTVYGCGQARYSYRGHEIIEHGGSIPGFMTQITRYPNDNLAIVALSNDGDGGLLAEAVKWRITDEVFGLPPIDWDTRYRKQNEERDHAMRAVTPRPLGAQTPSAPFEDLEKTYHHLAYGILRPCYVSDGHTSSSSCSEMLSGPDAKSILAASEHDLVPTFIIPFKRDLSTHILLTYFDKNVFNASIIWTNKESRDAEGYGTEGGVLIGLDFKFEVEWVNPGEAGEGLAFKRGFWGAGAREPEGEGKASAEAWFELYDSS